MKTGCSLPAETPSIAAPRARALLMLVFAALSGCAGLTDGGHGGRLNATEKMMWSTYPIVTQKGVATGFIMGRRDPRAPGGVVPVMVSSAHALETVGRAPFVIATRRQEASGEMKVRLVQMQPVRGKETFYVRHPQHDLAAFDLRFDSERADSVGLQTFLDEKAIATPRAAPRAGEEVFFLGYPEALPGTLGAFPVLRSGRVASYRAGTAHGPGSFVIDSDVYPGDSGAPVFAAGRGGRPVLAGVIIRRAATDRRNFSHLAIAVEASVIRETLQLLAARESKAR